MKVKRLHDTTERERIIKEYCEQLRANELDNLEEMDKLLKAYNLSRLNQKKKSI